MKIVQPHVYYVPPGDTQFEIGDDERIIHVDIEDGNALRFVTVKETYLSDEGVGEGRA